MNEYNVSHQIDKFYLFPGLNLSRKMDYGWAANKNDQGATSLALQSDSNLVIYRNGRHFGHHIQMFTRMLF